ncbi:MAG: DUF4157 domain-containing protein [Proteobacteria bacterium]|nr:DUF4157 domain-containing protein [Pseudomonadota bacterium]
MRKWLLTALLIGMGGAAWHLGFGAEEPRPLVEKTRSALSDASTLNLEKAADYWLSQSGERRAENNVQASGTALALAIRLGRLEALRAGTKPVPDRLKRQFRKHFDEAVLDEALWTVAEPETRLGRILARWPVKEGAVTLGNVIVFKTENASRNRSLFAHELAHVEQYRELGIGEFASRYAANPEPIEAAARKKSRRVMRSL